MRITYLNPRGAMGGAEVALLNIITAIRQSQPDWDISLITPDDGSLVARANALGVACRVISFPKSVARLGDSGVSGRPAGEWLSHFRLTVRMLLSFPALAIAIVRLRNALRSLNPDVIHTNGFKMHVLGALSKPGGTPLIWHIHDYVSSRLVMARVIKALRKRASLILANSDSVKRDIERVCGSDIKVQTLYNAVDTNVFSPEGERLDLDRLSGLAVNGLREPLVRIGLVATFGRWKGHEVFLRALSLLPPDIHWRGYVIGDAVYVTDGSQFSSAELQTLARELGVANRVGFTGFVDHPAAAIRALDIVVHASTQPEPFGLTIVEAMACGRPVIVSKAGGVAELIQISGNGSSHNGKGRLLNSGPAFSAGAQLALSHGPGDAEELSARMIELARDAQLRGQLATEGRANVENKFNLDELARKLIPLYQTIA
jgi:glycosyltransferase involved in cell wall biosynthesis